MPNTREIGEHRSRRDEMYKASMTGGRVFYLRLNLTMLDANEE